VNAKLFVGCVFIFQFKNCQCAIHRVRTVMENLEKSWNFKMVFSRPGKVMEKNLNHQSFGKVMDICYNHVFIYAEFEIINIFFNPCVAFGSF